MSTTTATFTPEPIVTLANYFQEPYNLAVATARTCYAPRVISSDEVGRDEQARAARDRIAESIYHAGHHTTIQHPTFQFILDRVSRQFIWSFLHAHPYYNSEQVSQRYVEVKPENFATPPLADDARAAYVATIHAQMDAYHRLIGLVEPTVEREYRRLFPQRSLDEKRWRGAIKKRCQEVARYALPVATHAHLYHTISGLTLHRYHRLCREFDTPLEQQLVVQKMVDAVTVIDPEFFKRIEDPLPPAATPEYQLLSQYHGALTAASQRAFLDEFDRSLDGRTSLLVDYNLHGAGTMAQAVRSVLGLTTAQLSDEDAIDWVLNPARNHLFAEALNLTTLDKLTRTMSHPHFTFRKKLSHTADSQDQRHRMTPASRPVLARHLVLDRPDYIVPVLVRATPAALSTYEQVMERTWEGMRRLRALGVDDELVMYLLPNAFPIRFEESGDLLNLHHKWTKRLCYTAQEEIWNACREEVLQVQQVFPQIARYLRAPCALRQGAGVTPFCPEGDRFCGVAVWKQPLEAYHRLI